jgi:hypothetical protein
MALNQLESFNIIFMYFNIIKLKLFRFFFQIKTWFRNNIYNLFLALKHS